MYTEVGAADCLQSVWTILTSEPMPQVAALHVECRGPSHEDRRGDTFRALELCWLLVLSTLDSPFPFHPFIRVYPISVFPLLLISLFSVAHTTPCHHLWGGTFFRLRLLNPNERDRHGAPLSATGTYVTTVTITDKSYTFGYSTRHFLICVVEWNECGRRKETN
jgi:hypothetical protein